MELAIESDENNAEFESIDVTSTNSNPANPLTVQVTVSKIVGSNGRVVRVGSVTKNASSTGSVRITDITTVVDLSGAGGNIGGAGTSRSGTIRVDAITRLEAARHLTASVEATTGSISLAQTDTVGGTSGNIYGDLVANSGSVVKVIAAGSIGNATIRPSIHCQSNITNITAGASVNADIVTTGGNLQRLVVAGDFAGSLGATSVAAVNGAEPTTGLSVSGNCDAAITLSGSALLPVAVTGALNANLAAVSTSQSGTISIGSIPSGKTLTLSGAASQAAVNATLTIGSGGLAGTLQLGSSMSMGDILKNITINGPFTGTLRSMGSLGTTTPYPTLALNGGLASNGKVIIGDSLKGTINVAAPGGGNPGLAGQIIINADNMSPAGTWTGTVTVGSTSLVGSSLTNGQYTTLPSALGGGSVGLAPFRLHKEACTPPHASTSPTDVLPSSFFVPGNTHYRTALNPAVTIRFYGPIELGAGYSTAIEALRIELQDPRAGNQCQYFDMTDAFEAEIPTSEGSRTITLHSAGSSIPKGGTYRVRSRATGAILSKDVSGSGRDVV